MMHGKCSVVPDGLPSKFTMSEKPKHGVGYVMQVAKCISLQVMHYAKKS